MSLTNPKINVSKHQVRIIAGTYRRRLLPVVAVPAACQLRPTPDRVRQTLFNWLEHQIPTWAGVRVLDAFAGTGALGLEAASRGAGHVLLCEALGSAAQSLQHTITLLKATQCHVYTGDVLAVLGRLPSASIDLLLLDPPFNQDWLSRIMPYLSHILAPQALVYVESEAPIVWTGFDLIRSLKAGMVHAQLLRYLN